MAGTLNLRRHRYHPRLFFQPPPCGFELIALSTVPASDISADCRSAKRSIEIALALNLVPCFTPVESPESNGMAEAFVKTFKRDYVRVSAIPDAAPPSP